MHYTTPLHLFNSLPYKMKQLLASSLEFWPFSFRMERVLDMQATPYSQCWAHSMKAHLTFLHSPKENPEQRVELVTTTDAKASTLPTGVLSLAFRHEIAQVSCNILHFTGTFIEGWGPTVSNAVLPLAAFFALQSPQPINIFFRRCSDAGIAGGSRWTASTPENAVCRVECVCVCVCAGNVLEPVDCNGH